MADYSPKNGEPRILPIYQSTTYKYDSSEVTRQQSLWTGSGLRRWLRMSPTHAPVCCILQAPPS